MTIPRQSREKSLCLVSVCKFEEGGLHVSVCVSVLVVGGRWTYWGFFFNAQIKQLLKKKKSLWLGHAPSSILPGMAKSVNRSLTSFLSWLYNAFQRGLVLPWKTHVRHWKGLIENEHQALNKQGRWWPFAPSAESPAHPVAEEQKKSWCAPRYCKNPCLWISPTLCSLNSLNRDRA